MKQLRIKDIFDIFNELSRRGMSLKEIKELPIYIGNDTELNGIHTAFYCEVIDKEYSDLVDMDCWNEPLKGISLLIR